MLSKRISPVKFFKLTNNFLSSSINKSNLIRYFSSTNTTSSTAKTAIVMMNMGGPIDQKMKSNHF